MTSIVHDSIIKAFEHTNGVISLVEFSPNTKFTYIYDYQENLITPEQGKQYSPITISKHQYIIHGDYTYSVLTAQIHQINSIDDKYFYGEPMADIVDGIATVDMGPFLDLFDMIYGIVEHLKTVTNDTTCMCC